MSKPWCCATWIGAKQTACSGYSRASLGKVRVVAKGVRKLHSRKAGHLEPFTRVGLLLARGREMMIVTQAEAVDTFPLLRDDLLRMGYASYVVELLDRFTYEEGQNIPMYRLLADTLSRLCTETDSSLVVHYYEMRLLDLLGFRPQLFHCVQCGNEIQPEDQYFSAAQGGVLCPTCGVNAPGARPISMQALKFLRHYQRSSYYRSKTRPSRIRPLSRDGDTAPALPYLFTGARAEHTRVSAAGEDGYYPVGIKPRDEPGGPVRIIVLPPPGRIPPLPCRSTFAAPWRQLNPYAPGGQHNPNHLQERQAPDRG